MNSAIASIETASAIRCSISARRSTKMSPLYGIDGSSSIVARLSRA
jgi:hypothetical protein